MSFNEKIDLHMHTTVSDGSDTPEEIITLVKKAGIHLFSVTDHDAVKGCQVIQEKLSSDDPAFICGAEFSCRDQMGKYHILGYHYDPDADAIQRLVDKSHNLRMKKVAARLDFIRDKFGCVFPEEEIDVLLSLDNPGKPHIGNLMVKYG
jgi:predicted metal-dependent phosphoesterase TrpH